MGHYGAALGYRWAIVVCHGAVRGLTVPLSAGCAGYRGSACTVALAFCRLSCVLGLAGSVVGLAGLCRVGRGLSGGYLRDTYQSIMVQPWLALVSVVGHSKVACGTL